MTEAEGIQSGVLVRDTAGEQAAVQHTVANTDSQAVAELVLRSTSVYLPSRPLTINGKPFTVSMDGTRLTGAVTAVSEYPQGTAAYPDLYPRQISVELLRGLTEVNLGDDSHPVINQQARVEPQPMLRKLKTGGTALNIIMPGEVRSDDYTEEGLTELLTRQVNKDLLIALSQNVDAKRRFRIGWKMSGIALSASIGEGVGIALSNNWTSMVEAGIIDAAIGGAAYIAGVLVYTRVVRGSLDEDSLPNYAVRKSRDYQKIHRLLEKTSKAGPIISIKPTTVESE